MFSKTALVVSMAAGGGMGSTIKDMTVSLRLWGISKICTFGYAVSASKWEDVTEKNRTIIEHKIKKLSRKILLKKNKIKPNLKIKLLFLLFRMIQKKYGYIQYDKDYWEGQGWLEKNRPWKT